MSPVVDKTACFKSGETVNNTGGVINCLIVSLKTKTLSSQKSMQFLCNNSNNSHGSAYIK